MFTLTHLILGILYTAGLSLLSVNIYCYLYGKHRKSYPKRLKLNKTKAGRNLDIGNQAGRDVIIKEKAKPCERELFLFAQCKDMQNTISQLMQQLDVKSKIIFQLQDQVGDTNAQQTRYFNQLSAQEEQLRALREENDALWDENTRMKYEQLANRFPVINLKSKDHGHA